MKTKIQIKFDKNFSNSFSFIGILKVEEIDELE